MLTRWRARGLVVRDLRTQVWRLEVRRHVGRVGLAVAGRIAGGTAEGWSLPHDAPTTRRVVLRRDRRPVAGPRQGGAEAGAQDGGDVPISECIAGGLQHRRPRIDRAEELGRHPTGAQPDRGSRNGGERRAA